MSSDLLSSAGLVRPALRAGRGRLVLAVALATCSALLEMVPIWAVWRLTVWISEGGAQPGDVWRLALLMALTIPAGFLLFGLATRQSHILAFNLIHDLRLRLARHIARLPMGYFSNMPSGQAKQTIITEPEKLELLIAHALPEGTSALITWLAVTGWLFAVDWRMALAATVLTPVAFLAMGRAISNSMPATIGAQQAVKEMNGAVVEHLSNMPAVKIFNPRGVETSDISAAITRVADMQSALGRAFAPLGGTFHALVLSNIAVIVIVGAWLVQTNRLDLATLLFFVILGANYSLPLMRLFDLFHHFAHISLSATAAQDILARPVQADSHAVVPLTGHEIRFENVGFAYADSLPVLRDISFHAPAGTVTALVGPSGAGKSTIAALIPRLHDVGTGRITLGGVDIRDIGLDQLMDAVAFVFQEPFLFTASIAENIRFSRPDASDDELRAAARAAQADGFIAALPDGYDTVIGQGHVLLSGGERQRVALARAILKDAPVVVLDEATAFTDPDSEYEIQQALAALTRGKTVIVIPHRLHSITGADQILTVDRGRIVERGTHASLLAARGIYARLWADYSAARGAGLRQVKEGDHAV